MSNYNFKEIEKKWQQFWADNPELCRAEDDSDKEKKYILDMFPYPSGDGLHVGHVESYAVTDIISRYWRMNGKNVLHPQGWDAFGLPAENYAIKTGTHPDITTHQNIKNFTRQIKGMGMSYDWSREIDTSSPEYYKWTQWFFLLLYKNGLAYKKKAKVNWCPKCQTVLANEQAEGGVCERCKTEVMQKDLEQWFFKITDFIEDNQKTSGLIAGLEKVDWPESTRQAQRNWIGKSVGEEVKFKIANTDSEIVVYTTRVDTIFGCTYCVVAPEHQIVQDLICRGGQISNWDEVEKYLIAAQNKTDLERMEAKEKTGVELKGVRVVNPFNKEEVPLFVADYVLGHYGTGAVMAVPAHDERDFEFAKKYNLFIKQVILTRGSVGGHWDETIQNYRIQEFSDEWNDHYANDGKLIDSGEFTNLTSADARQKMTAWLEEKNLGREKINYKLRDWLVSRQRYWGAPIPIVYCEYCGTVPVPESELPVILPTDVDFKPTGESPLVYSKTFHNVKCPQCGGAARRESDTMDTFVCSSWYYLRYADPQNEKEFAAKEKLEKWLPVDLYVGGAEHSVLHLLYARFFTKILHRLGYVRFDEPFLKLRHQGIILAEDGRKMSKSLGNVINPDSVVAEHGADALRIFEMFMGPMEDMKPWNTQGIVGIKRFLEKVWKVLEDGKVAPLDCQAGGCAEVPREFKTLLHKTIKKVTEDVESFNFNTAISQMMILINLMTKMEKIPQKAFEKFLTILSPFAPHIAEELWQKLGHNESIFKESWPRYNPEMIKEAEIKMAVQINGKVRDLIVVSSGIFEEEARQAAFESAKVKENISGKEVKKVIFVPGKLINIVVG